MRPFFMTFLLLFSHAAFSIDWGVKGQVSGWITNNFADMNNTQIGLRYIPEASLSQDLSDKSLIDAELSLNTFSSYDFKTKSGESNLATYRVWLRYSASQFEARIGLQQIKFAPAMILRPLMWFDQLDPRDPLQLTNGVTGALLRYYFLNNANVWLWGLMSNGERKGLEIMPTVDNSFEYGGRFQYPLGTGEIALTYHHRQADPNPLLKGWLTVTLDPLPENRYALDGKWDIGIGLWFESALIHKDIDYYPANYQKYLTIGADYTFGLGNGVHVLGEHLFMNVAKDWHETNGRTEFTAILADYSVTLWDVLMGIVYYNWETNESYQFLTWRRTFDNWSFNVALYWNPETPSMAGLSPSETNTFGLGKGFQFMVIYNH
ncbi:hypothetical protein EH223_08280 [candidate division KSB1 bacterium]|nr:hypothetical protein [candidate division KSB1 bacterium]RQW04188.1 MAG: hypothetical protein EH223_08280 [candidate division KSB1 bacterium]